MCVISALGCGVFVLVCVMWVCAKGCKMLKEIEFEKKRLKGDQLLCRAGMLALISPSLRMACSSRRTASCCHRNAFSSLTKLCATSVHVVCVFVRVCLCACCVSM